MHVDIGLTAWTRYVERLEYFVIVVNALHAHVVAKNPTITCRFVCAYETEAPADLLAVFRDYCAARKIALVPHVGPPSLGATLNLLFEVCRSPYVLYIQDDFRLNVGLTLTADVAFLESQPTFASVAYSFKRVPAEHRIPLPDDGQSIPLCEISPNTHNFYSDHPHLKRRSFHELTGPFMTHDSCTCEMDMNHRIRRLAQAGHPLRAAGRGNGRGFFLHIGTTSSMTEKQERCRKEPT
jgi:hypothetical protein